MEKKCIRFDKGYLFPLLLGGIIQALPLIALKSTVLTTVSALLWPFFMLLATRRTEKKREFLLCLGVMALSKTLRNLLLFGTNPLYFGAVLALCIFVTLLETPAFLLDRLITRSDSPIASLVFPLLFTLSSILVSVLSLGNQTDPAALLANIPVLAQCASLITEYGLCFFFIWISSLLALAVDGNIRRRVVGISVTVLLSVILLVFGLIQLSVRDDPVFRFNVALCTSFEEEFDSTTASRTEEDYYLLVERELNEAVQKGADLVMFVEEHFFAGESAFPEYLEKISSLVKEKDIPILLPFEIERPGQKSINEAILFDHDGTPVLIYVKANLVPVVETANYERGSGELAQAVITIAGRECKVALSLCYDINDFVFMYGMDPDTSLVLSPSWEWSYSNVEQERSATLRALENRVTVIKATQDGYHLVSDPYGRTVFRESSIGAYETVTMAEVPVYEMSPGENAFSMSLEFSTSSGEITSAIMLLILLVSLCFQMPTADQKSRIYLVCLVLTILGLLTDAFSYIFDGSRWNDLTCFIVNLGSYAFVDIIMISFAVYFEALLLERHGVHVKMVLNSMLLPALDIVFLTFAAHKGLLFTITNGTYKPGPWDSYSSIAPGLSILSVLIMAVLNRRKLNTREYSAIILYMVLPLSASLLAAVFGGMDSLSYIAVSLSMLILFVLIQAGTLEQSRIREEVLLEVSLIDQLTSLNNRRAIDKRFDEYGEYDPFAVIFCDLNGLKEANDTYGHAAGDALLIRFANLLRQHFRQADIYRISGDEFVVLPFDPRPEEFEIAAEKFKADVVKNGEIASVGWAYGVGETKKATLSLAEKKMYEDKHEYHVRTGKPER